MIRYRVFASLAAAALLFRWEPGIFLHVWRGGNVTWSGWVPVLLAFGVLARPDELRWLLAMYAGIALDAFVIAPEAPNHYVLTTIVGLATMATAAAVGWRRGRMPTGEEVLDELAGPLRVAVIVFYLFTGVWKSNAGFVDPEFSCGARSWARLDAQFGILPDGDGVRYAVMAFTLALEYLGPLLLAIPRTRAAMAAFFVLFHAVLGLDLVQNYQNFSWAMMPLLALFLPADAFERLAERLPSPAGRWGRLNLLFGHALLLVVAWFSHVELPSYAVQPWVGARWLSAVVSLWAWFAVFCGAAWVSRGAAPAPARSGAPVAWLALALILLNGMSPVIGLKNRNAWQMYSNVRIEAGASNHWFLPPSLDVFGLQSDLVTIVDTNDLELARMTKDAGLQLTWWDFRVWLDQNPNAKVTYDRGGQRYVLAGRSEFPEPPPWLLRKVVWFRPVGEEVARQCVW